MSLTHRFVQVRDLRLHLLDFGGEGPRLPVLLCLHGVTGHAWTWAGVAEALEGRARVVALDQRGHGDSQWSAAGAYGTTELAEDLFGVLEAEALGPVNLVGLSWGGLVGLRLAAAFPHLVRSLTVVDVAPSTSAPPGQVPPRPYEFDSHAAVREWERQANPHAPDAMVEALAAFGTRPGPRGQLVRKHDPCFQEQWPFRAEDHWDAWRVLAVPTLLVRAAGSPVLDEASFDEMSAQVVGLRRAVVADSGHLVPVEQPEAFAALVEEFVAAAG
ncbi:MAG: alpha/beta fold hydrolase [Acidimicrobiia bacterium]|nr:alpha/beta fold hydrolase [Acidimicrobiia bacterium]